MEWTIEACGAETLVRVVQSGFAGESEAEEEFYGSTEYGWRFMLTNLRHYIERHAGAPRIVAWPRKKISLWREEAYKRLVAANGLFLAEATSALQEGVLQAGMRYSLRAATGEDFAGRVEFVAPPRGFCVSVESLGDALLWLTIEGVPPNHEVQLWLSAYGIKRSEVDEFTRRWTAELDRIFGNT